MSDHYPARQLLLLRHAKSSLAEGGQRDIGRPLNQRGMEAAAAMGREINRLGLLPDKILCSPARRAQETLRIVLQQFAVAPAFSTNDDIYDFGDGGKLLDVIRAEGGKAERLLLVGHNPSIEELAKRLVGGGGAALRQNLATKFPAAALAVIAFAPGAWVTTGWSGGELTHFIRPRDLPS